MLEAAEAVVELVRGLTFDAYRRDRRTRRAVEREIEIIGEAARGVSDEFKIEHAAIQWRKIIAQRHMLAHEYGEIQDELIWMVATKHVPELIALLKPLISLDDDA